MTWHPMKKMVDKSLAPLKPLVDGEEEYRHVIAQLREKIKDLEFELIDLRVQMDRKNTFIEHRNAEIYRLERELESYQGAKT
jgi:predicted RNase H-like nuclease (RuvC/YqgF family)